MRRVNRKRGGVLRSTALLLAAIMVISGTIFGHPCDAYAAGNVTVTKEWNDGLSGTQATNRATPTLTATGVMTQSDIVDMLYPVGSEYVTSTNASPASYLGGEWTLIDKEFKSQNLSPTLTYNTTYTDSSKVAFVARSMGGHSVHIRCRILLKSAISGDIKPVTWDVTKLGFNTTSSVFVWYPYSVDSMKTEACADAIRVYQANNAIYVTYILTSVYTNMADSYCDKFFWKRTG